MSKVSSVSKSGAAQPSDEMLRNREAALLAPYAMHSVDSRGREYPELPHPYRGPFQRDRDRIVHSAAYRRLSYKTQVFTNEMGDYHRTRLTHTLEVASIARTFGRALRLNEDLIEALALAHDIGHPPFGHAGEDTLNACLQDEGGFNHNSQALRIFRQLEVRYHEFPGLNLSVEVLEGQASRVDKTGHGRPSLLEVQVVDVADSIAYDTHDADDALESGLVSLETLLELPLWSEAADRVLDRRPGMTGDDLRRAVLHELIDSQVSDLLERGMALLAETAPESSTAARQAGIRLEPSRTLAEKKSQLEAFLHDRVYRHPLVMAQRRTAQAELRQMFELFVQRPELLPQKFRQQSEADGLSRSVADYLAGMTDRFIQQEFRRLFAN